MTSDKCEAAIVKYLDLKKSGSMEMSQICSELKKESFFSEDEIKRICREISEQEFEHNTPPRAGHSFHQTRILSWTLGFFWLGVALVVGIFNGIYFQLNNLMFWITIGGSLLLMVKNLYTGLRKRKSI